MAEEHFDLGTVISSLLKTPPHHLTSVNTTNVTCTPALSVVGEGEREFSGVMIYDGIPLNSYLEVLIWPPCEQTFLESKLIDDQSAHLYL